MVRQLVRSLELVVQAMDACVEQANARNLSKSMIFTVSEQFEFVSSAMVRGGGVKMSALGVTLRLAGSPWLLRG